MDRTSLIILISCIIFLVMMVSIVIRVPCILTIKRLFGPCSFCFSRDKDDVESLLKQDGVVRILTEAAAEARYEEVALTRSESGYCSNSSKTGKKTSVSRVRVLEV
eukprot:GFUD01045736.1.p1 GENE.GFUD01045736.1~~GFUD01045736.1.p1  ORF type:complete len:106 (+),score=13.37 GFUD01045736.1:56-373(+)